ncbi:patatin-like phospholipase family protein [Methylobacterium sp. P31]
MSPRDQHLFGPGPKRMLSLSGGGVRGAISIAFLERLEEILDSRAGTRVRLCDHFDLIGGTSTGALIAGALVLGYRASQIREFYETLAPRVFRKPRWRILGLQAKFDARNLQQEIDAILGDRTLDSPDLQTGLAIVMKRMDTGSPWVLTNSPTSAYWDTPPDGSYIGNRQLRLGNLVRASTAAPHYFDPELVQIAEGQAPALFVDGGVTPYNNPSLQLLMIAAFEGYGLRWPLGADKLSIMSIGTGVFRERLSYEDSRRLPAAGLAVRALTGLMADAEASAMTLLHWLSGTNPHWPINTELGRLTNDSPPFQSPLFTFEAYNVRLEREWLRDTLDLDLSEDAVHALRRMDEPSLATPLYDIGRRAAERLMSVDGCARWSKKADHVAGPAGSLVGRD